jgi:hypothetical protein
VNPNADDLKNYFVNAMKMGDQNVDDHSNCWNYSVDAMKCYQKTVYHLKDGQMMAFHLKKYLMLNVMADAPLRDDQMKDVMTLP